MMSKKKKIIIWVTSIVVVLALAITLFGGNYLVNFAIKRTEEKRNVAPPSVVSDEGMSQIKLNAEMINEKREAWLADADIKVIEATSDDGLNLKADMIISNPGSHKWVIACHGYRGNRSNLRNVTCYYAEQGYNAVLPDLRGCGESEGGYVGMGWPDRKDMLKWIEYITAQDTDAEIILHGISMGGATVMMTSGEELPAQVKAIVEDCGYTSVWDIFSDELKFLFHLPDFPLMYSASMISDIKAGYGFKEASSLEQVAKCKVPMLFIHGSEDNFVHTEMVYKVYEVCKTEKNLLVVDGAGHGNSYLYDPELYFGTVFEFVGKYVK